MQDSINGLSLDSKEFAESKATFDVQLQDTLRKMLTQGHKSASLTFKLNIELLGGIYNEQPVTFPRFDAKITSTIKQQQEQSSSFGNGTAIVYDELYKTVYMVTPEEAAGQISMFGNAEGE